jgi:hypothetical protein
MILLAITMIPSWRHGSAYAAAGLRAGSAQIAGINATTMMVV